MAETVCDMLLPAKTTVCEKWLPAETVGMIMLPVERLSTKQNHADRLGRKPFIMAGSKILLTVLAEVKY